MSLLKELRLENFNGFYKYFVPTGLRNESYNLQINSSRS